MECFVVRSEGGEFIKTPDKSRAFDSENSQYMHRDQPSSEVGDLWAFADESGIHRSAKYSIMSGHVSTKSEWLRFNGLWGTTLRHYGVETFHAIDFFQPNRKRSTSNPFRRWSVERRVCFLEELVAAAESCMLFPIGGVVETEAFYDLTDEQRRYFTGGHLESHWTLERSQDSEALKPVIRRKFKTSGAPSRTYLMALNLILEESLGLSPEGSAIHFVLDRQTSLEANVKDYVGRVWVPLFSQGETRIADIEFDSSKEVPPLQLADLLAYVQWKQLQGTASADTARVLSKLLRGRPKFTRADKGFFHNSWVSLQEDLGGENRVANVVDGRLEINFSSP